MDTKIRTFLNSFVEMKHKSFFFCSSYYLEANMLHFDKKIA